MECTGNEATILSCKSSGLGNQNCTSGQAVWLKCETKIPPVGYGFSREEIGVKYSLLFVFNLGCLGLARTQILPPNIKAMPVEEAK